MQKRKTGKILTLLMAVSLLADPVFAQEQGATLFSRMECATCHTVDPDAPASTGPPMYGLYGREVNLQDGSTVTADEAYLRESIQQAGAKIVAGYMPVMPSYEDQLTEEELNLLVSYIKYL